VIVEEKVFLQRGAKFEVFMNCAHKQEITGERSDLLVTNDHDVRHTQTHGLADAHVRHWRSFSEFNKLNI
jgi:hypothetical protein